MCGIAGIIGGDAAAANQVVAMVNAMTHRGPDAGRVMALPGAVLGFRRLSIIDLDNRAMQPMISACGRYALVYNGEIYNYKEVKAEIGARYPFVTQGDTEVLLAAWTIWGEGCLEKLNGMFAFCVYDLKSRSAFLARDRLGQKPLFFRLAGAEFAFASEVKPLLEIGASVRPNAAVWARYLRLALYDDTRGTFFDDVEQLEPGECLTVDASMRVARRRYYDFGTSFTEAGTDSLEAVAEKLRAIVVTASDRHMRADVKVGVMLSGGLDSSAMLAGLDLAGRLGPSVGAYSVEFGADLTERPWIQATLDHHGVPGRIEAFDPQGFLDSLVPVMWQLEAPVGGLMTNALTRVFSAARSDGVTVLLHGAGPDEILGGYRNLHNYYLGTLLQQDDARADAAIAAYAGFWDVTAAEAKAAGLREISTPSTAIDGTIPYRAELLDRSVTESDMAEAFALTSSGDAFRDKLIAYTQRDKIPRGVRFLDRLAMGYGIEVRLPFLDVPMVDACLGMSADHMYHAGRSKSVLREALGNGAMDDAVRLAKKRSIQAPQGIWLGSEPMRSYVRDILGSSTFRQLGMFDVKACQKAYDEYLERPTPNSFFIWQWINAYLWVECFKGSPRMTAPVCPDLLPQSLPKSAMTEIAAHGTATVLIN